MPSVTSPLQLTVSAALLQNQGLRPVPTALTSAIAAFNATTVIQNYSAALAFYNAQTFAKSPATLVNLLSIGSTVCPALGNSIPASPLGTYTYLTNTDGFSNLIDATATAYIGDGEAGKFCQGFMAVQGYIASTNQYINSSVNVNQYLGPMFTNMDDLVTANIASVSTDLPNFGVDLTKQGNLWNMAKLDLYGTPAGLIQQISALAGIKGRTVPDLQNAMISMGLTASDIANLVNDNRVGLNRPTGLTQNEFDKLQLLAYNSMTMITGDALAQILDILSVTTPNIDSLDDLLNPLIMFPLSYASLQTPSPNGAIPIFSSTGSVNSNIAPVVNSYLPTATGCDELGKVIPPAQAVANKAIQVALQQINNIPNSTLPKFAEAVVGTVDNLWTVTQEYLANAVVSWGTPVPSFYRATVDVPAGVDINNTAYWSPTTLGGLNTMAGLPLIQAQTTPVDSSVTSYISNNLATGTGPNGTITTYDVLGLAIDSNNFAAQLNTATTAMNSLNPVAGTFIIGQTYTITSAGTTNFTLIGAANNNVGTVFIATGPGTGTGTATQNANIVSLNNAYIAIASAGNDAAVQTQIDNANAAITALSASPYVTTLNTTWTYMANLMNLSYKYTDQAGVDYFNLQGDTNSIYSFSQNLPYYGLLTASGDAVEFLQNLADTTVLGGQAIVGAMREGRNNARLSTARMYNTNQVPSAPDVDPIPAITPVT